MKLAIIGSREISDINIADYLTETPTKIISGGAKGIDTLAAEYAKKNNIPFTEHLPDYNKYGRAAPIIRNRLIVQDADKVIAFWNGKSRGTLSSINMAKKMGKQLQIIKIQ